MNIKKLNSFQIRKRFFKEITNWLLWLFSSSFFKNSLNDPTVKIFKRLFDILSVIVIIGLLSWLTPILAILIKLDSRGSLFLVKRNGLNSIEFNCYKYRSMEVNEQTDLIQG
jgi:putative colanic acid biosynthesis UDP-glucose lipid carrier transferase